MSTTCFLFVVLPIVLIAVLARLGAEKRKEAEAKLLAARQEAANRGLPLAPPPAPGASPLLSFAAKAAGAAAGAVIKSQLGGGGHGHRGHKHHD